ncbi:microtubule-associated protein RP/EB family member 3, putative [Eimeria mitis]|uniref:Microtubule-associated protein RP/EB family member 3, putative n=1 Tax=Eimeria mitis TaxID=44415 RepID=U6KIC1_9EIME|nr:microtubule-associated protein RP/EB family member 3, putative [Eimeria mitis]CDJ35992.1 microtubule-associated protein RP/EB family member 3, putative [Eimeria mitis]
MAYEEGAAALGLLEPQQQHLAAEIHRRICRLLEPCSLLAPDAEQRQKHEERQKQVYDSPQTQPAEAEAEVRLLLQTHATLAALLDDRLQGWSSAQPQLQPQLQQQLQAQLQPQLQPQQLILPLPMQQQHRIQQQQQQMLFQRNRLLQLCQKQLQQHQVANQAQTLPIFCQEKQQLMLQQHHLSQQHKLQQHLLQQQQLQQQQQQLHLQLKETSQWRSAEEIPNPQQTQIPHNMQQQQRQAWEQMQQKRTWQVESYNTACSAAKESRTEAFPNCFAHVDSETMSLNGASPALCTGVGGGGRDADPSSVGMMEGAFFVSRTELLDWLNNTLALRLTRVEQCASGCVYLQALDNLFGPQSRVPMNKVKWGAKHEYEFVHNYKLLQAAFDAHDVHKHIEVNRLVKAKYQDNLEFLQWFKAFCDRQAALYATDVPYDPVERRKLGIGPFPVWAPVGGDGGAKKPSAAYAASTATTRPAAGAQPSTRCRVQQQQPQKQQPAGAGAGTDAASGALGKRLQQQQPQQRSREDAAAAAAAAAAVETLQGELQQAVLERDFYYGKLRRIEILCGVQGQTSLSVEAVQAILYAKDHPDEQPEAAEGNL